MESACMRAQPQNQVSYHPKEAHCLVFILVNVAQPGIWPSAKQKIDLLSIQRATSFRWLILTNLRRKILYRITVINVFMFLYICSQWKIWIFSIWNFNFQIENFQFSIWIFIQNIFKLMASICQACRSTYQRSQMMTSRWHCEYESAKEEWVTDSEDQLPSS